MPASRSVDDTAFATRHAATFFATGSAHDTVDVVHGDFRSGEAVADVPPATPTPHRPRARRRGTPRTTSAP
ncbi:MAG: hypothetical protein M3R48_03375 [Candidatus Dormibacteraeota bacterium]|nr:hypothetical protein [Candidatus Dormibacteraeota bacterium]